MVDFCFLIVFANERQAFNGQVLPMVLLIHKYIKRQLAIVNAGLPLVQVKQVWIGTVFEKYRDDLEKSETASIL